jgi:hypothetical protein
MSSPGGSARNNAAGGSRKRRQRRRQLARRDGDACWYCAVPFAADLSDATFEHLVRVADLLAAGAGGAELRDTSNMVLACLECNWLANLWPQTGRTGAFTPATAQGVYADALAGLLAAPGRQVSYQPRLDRRGRAHYANGAALPMRWLEKRGFATEFQLGTWQATAAGEAALGQLAATGKLLAPVPA